MRKLEELGVIYAQTTQGKWEEGRTSHHTVCNGGRHTHDNYAIAEFHHADDAAFVDCAHEYWPTLLEAALEIENLHDNLKLIGFGGEEEISGADLVDMMQDHFERIQALMARLQ